MGSKRVAVVGARGIGKHHAKWWALEGADVCGFVGTSAATVAQTRAGLAELFGYDGPGYTCLQELIDAERPDIVDVCSPAECHYMHVKTALSAGCDVLCEKPFVYDNVTTTADLLAHARELVRLAAANGRLLGICSQYAVAAQAFLALWQEHNPGRAVHSWRGRLASPTRGRPPVSRDTWIDLGPHLLSALQAAFPGAVLRWETAQARFAKDHQAAAAFNLICADESAVACRLVVDRTQGDPANVREMEFESDRFVVAGRNDAAGVYCASYVTPWGDFPAPDIMRALIGRFLRGEAVIDGAAAVTNLEWLLGIRDLAVS